MSELMYMLGEIDRRVRPFVFAVRFWGKITGIANARTMTNFPLSCLALCFLQRLPEPILPTLGELKAAARKTDIRINEDNTHYTFLRDISLMRFTTKNTDSLETLLRQFFEFIMDFEFQKHSLSLNSGRNVRKMDGSAMFIENPFEIELNVSKAMVYGEVGRMKIIAKDSLTNFNDAKNNKNKNWGILNFSENSI